jgi:hypothetical protein
MLRIIDARRALLAPRYMMPFFIFDFSPVAAMTLSTLFFAITPRIAAFSPTDFRAALTPCCRPSAMPLSPIAAAYFTPDIAAITPPPCADAERCAPLFRRHYFRPAVRQPSPLRRYHCAAATLIFADTPRRRRFRDAASAVFDSADFHYLRFAFATPCRCRR